MLKQQDRASHRDFGLWAGYYPYPCSCGSMVTAKDQDYSWHGCESVKCRRCFFTAIDNYKDKEE
ncbi:MAG: hypothetical protein ACYTEU_06170 [Planctomycetota bacterium]|jgi:hypothetical protein